MHGRLSWGRNGTGNIAHRAHLEKVHEFLAMGAIGKKEVDSLVDFFDVYALLVCIVFQNELLQEHERPLVVHVLSHLHPFYDI